MAEAGKAHYRQRVAEIATLPPINGGVLLIGDSITEGWLQYDFPYKGPVANHGIGWDTSAGLLARKDLIFMEKPDIVFVMIGTNDLSYDRPVQDIAQDIMAFFRLAKRAWPNTKLYLQSVLPRDGAFEKDVTPLNIALKAVFNDLNVQGVQLSFIDLEPLFSGAPGVLRPELTRDSLHINAAGYKVWGQALKPYLP